MITVVNRKTHVSTPNDVYIGRGSALGNPYPMPKYTREECILLYQGEINLCLKTRKDTDNLKYLAVKTMLNMIYAFNKAGKQVNLVCYCAPEKCHGDVIKQLIEGV